MRKTLLFLAIIPALTFISTGCKKSDPGCTYTESGAVAPASEIAALQAWVNTNHPAAVQHPSGIFYEIVAPGTGSTTASVCSQVTVKYTGYLTNGSKFDENLTGVTFTLGNLIVGWQKGIPLIKSGGTINLYIPPSLAYGSNAVGSVPANSYLVFVIQLMNVQ